MQLRAQLDISTLRCADLPSKQADFFQIKFSESQANSNDAGMRQLNLSENKESPN